MSKLIFTEAWFNVLAQRLDTIFNESDSTSNTFSQYELNKELPEGKPRRQYNSNRAIISYFFSLIIIKKCG